jgi:DNA-binding NarL/FixJ family response regulator
MRSGSTSTSAQTKQQTYSLIIVDDHPAVRRGMREIYSLVPEFNVVAEASSINQTLEQLASHAVDLAIVDLGLGDESGLELIKRLRKQYPKVKVLVASMHDDHMFSERAIRVGAGGYVNKSAPEEELIKAARTVLAGRLYLHPQVAADVLVRSVNSGRDAYRSPVDQLSDRELEVFRLVGQGKTTRQIAEELELSPKTVDTHREHIKSKLDIANTNELVHQATVWWLERV